MSHQHSTKGSTQGSGEHSPAVATLVAQHRTFLAFLERRLQDRALAEDILQDAFVRGIDKASTLRDDESVQAWFYRMLRNAVVDHYRRGASRARALEKLAAELATESGDSDAQGKVCACVAEVAKTLKPEYADTIQRIEIDGVAVKDYADEVGISRSNAGVRVFRARNALLNQVRAACGTCATHGCADCSCQSK